MNNEYQNRLDYQKRIVEEKKELDSKIKDLDLFFKEYVYLSLITPDKLRVRQQRTVMKEYSDILGGLIRNFSQY